MAVEIAAEHIAVLDRHVAALRERRHGRMRGVAQQRHAAPGPLRNRIAVVDAPFVDVLDVAEHVEQRFVPALVGREQLLLRARRRPGFLDPLIGDVAGEDVEHRAVADRIADHVAVRSDPAEVLAVRKLDRQPRPDPGRHALHRHHAAPAHQLGEARIVGAEQLRADGGADAVGADHRVGLDLAAVGKARHRAVLGRGRADAIGVEMDRSVRQRVPQQLMQVRAVQRRIGCAVFLLRRRPERRAVTQAGVVPLDRDLVHRLEGDGVELLARARARG